MTMPGDIFSCHSWGCATSRMLVNILGCTGYPLKTIRITWLRILVALRLRSPVLWS